jgi:hypothetical protein
MSWFSENKFLAVFGGVMLVGAGALGYLTLGARDEYTKAKEEYDGAASTLSTVISSKPSPLPENLEAYNARVKALKAQIETFQKDLATIELKTEPTTATGFQDKLKDAVAKVVARAGEMETKLPDKFYLGFEEYQAIPPKDAAVPSLVRELRSLEIFMALLQQSKGAELKKIARAELPGEKKQAEAPKPEKGGKGKGDTDQKLVQKLSLQVEFVVSQEHFQNIFNGLVGNKQQFFVVRNIHLKNDKPDAPSKTVLPGANPGAVAPAADGTPAAAAAPERPKLEAIFGNEKLEVVLDLDIMDFAEPEAPAVEKGSTKQSK